MSLRHRIVLASLSLLIAATVWLACVHLCFRKDAATWRQTSGVSPRSRALLASQLSRWNEAGAPGTDQAQMRRTNAEWDLMGRGFLVWSLANLCLRDPATQEHHLKVMDQIIDSTLRLEKEAGPLTFLMPYARARPYLVQPARSLFVDSEIALMLGVRCLVAGRADYQTELARRVQAIVTRMEASPLLAVESYPDECWTFDNTVALAAIRVADQLAGTNHRDLSRRWVASARERLTDAKTGLLISSYSLDGRAKDGPEGSSIWMVAHCLQVIDPEFARDQYSRAKQELAREVAGFGYSREWPVSWNGPVDVDSGAVIPVLGISAGGSGLAFVAAAAFGDNAYMRALMTTLDFAAFPEERQGRLCYHASNQVGDAVLLYSTVLGPLWEKLAYPEAKP